MKKQFLFPVLLLLVFSQHLSAQWSLKHASSVMQSTYLPCHSVIGNKVYMVGTPNGTDNYVYEYDAATNSYAQKTATPFVGFNDQVSFTLNSQMYLVTLSNQSSKAYDPPSDNWITKDPSSSLNSILMNLYPPSQYGFVFNGSLFAFSLNNKAYIGGLTVFDVNTSMESMSPYVFVFDPSTNNYSALIVPSIMTSYNILVPAVFELNGKGYVIGTQANPSLFSGAAGVYEFDPSGNSFTAKNACNCGDMGYSSFVLSGVAYINVIQNCENYSPVFTFDPVANSWTPSDTVFHPDTLDLKMGFAVNGKGYLGYGSTYNGNCGLSAGHSRLYEYSIEILGTQPETKEQTCRVFPNPAEHSFTFCREGNATFAADAFMIRDVQGKTIGRFTMNPGETTTTFDLSEVPAGTYIIDNENRTLHTRLLVFPPK